MAELLHPGYKGNNPPHPVQLSPGRWGVTTVLCIQARGACPDGNQQTQTVICVSGLNDKHL